MVARPWSQISRRTNCSFFGWKGLLNDELARSAVQIPKVFSIWTFDLVPRSFLYYQFWGWGSSNDMGKHDADSKRKMLISLCNLKMGQSWPLFVYFCPFRITISIIQIETSIYVVLGIRTRGRSMTGADETTELWWTVTFLVMMLMQLLQFTWLVAERKWV